MTGRFLKDAAASLGEISRLHHELEQLQRKHMPLAGEPGAPVVCTGCSLHGAQVPWPCETYAFTAANLPERR